MANRIASENETHTAGEAANRIATKYKTHAAGEATNRIATNEGTGDGKSYCLKVQRAHSR